MSSFVQPTGVDFSFAAIVQTIHRAVVQQSYAGEGNADPSTCASLALSLRQQIRKYITRALQSTPASAVNWEAQVLSPLIADFSVVQDLGVSVPDAEYIVLLACAVGLAHDVLLLPDVSYQHSACDSLVNIFKQCFCEPQVCGAVLGRLEEEQRRLVRAGANLDVQQAVGVLRELMPDLSASAVAWWDVPGGIIREDGKNSVQSIQAQLDMDISAAGSSASTSARLAGCPRDLQVHVFLKPGCSMDLDFVDAVASSDASLVVTTRIGLRMAVQPGYTVSAIAGIFDTVTLRASSSTVPNKLFAATVVIPSGYSFRIADVEWVSELQNDLAQTIVETNRYVVIIGGGHYVLTRRNAHRSVLVESSDSSGLVVESQPVLA
jgi:hypothetical protein